MGINRTAVLQTPRLRLRRFFEGDLPLLHRMVSDAEVMRYYRSPLDMDGARAWLASILRSYERFGYSFFAIERRWDHAFIGQAGLLHWDDVDTREDVEVAYMLAREHWGHGYAGEAARACRDWAFEHLDVDRVVSFIAVENARSMNVARANGMRELKRLESNRFGQPIYVYGIDRETWQQRPRLVPGV